MASQFVYKLSCLDSPNDEHYKNFKAAVRDYIWNGKTSKIAYDTLTVLSELFVVGGSDEVYRRMRLCRVALYNHKYLFGGGVRGVWGSAPRKF